MDFEVDRLDDELVNVGLDSEQSACCSWLGAIYHLTPEAIRETLDRVTEVSTTGSRAVFDFKIAIGKLSQEWRTLCGKMEGTVVRRGEAMLTDFAPQSLREILAQHGYTEVETMPREE